MNGNSTPYGKRLVTNVIDSIAQETPHRPYASIPVNDEDLSHGFRDVTYAQLAAAIDAAAHWLDEYLGKAPSGTFPTHAYMGPKDLRYPILTGAAVKTGRKILLPSLLTSSEANTHMVKMTSCRAFLHTKETLPLVRGVQKELADVEAFLIPDCEEWLTVDAGPKYEYNKSWEDAKEDPVVTVHTSGSSGFPKLVTWTNEMFALLDATRLVPTVDGIPASVPAQIPVRENTRYWLMLPLFHVAALLLGFVGPAYCSYTAVFGPAHLAPTAALADEMHRFAGIEGGVYAPALLEELVANASYKANLLKLKTIICTGAPLPKHVGDLLAERKILTPMIGSTEAGWLVTVPTNPISHLTDGRQLDNKLDWRDWEYFRFHPWTGATFEHACDGMYELVVIRTPESKLTIGYWSVPELKGITHFRTKDLWSPHPDSVKREKGLWRYQGRLDDLIVLTGEVKMYVASAEDRLKAKNPMIKAAIAGGQGRKTPFLLLELRLLDNVNGFANGEEQISLNDVWKTVEEVNETIVAETRFKKELVLITVKDKPFARLAKGSVDRRKTYELYEQEVNEMYEKAETH